MKLIRLNVNNVIRNVKTKRVIRFISELVTKNNEKYINDNHNNIIYIQFQQGSIFGKGVKSI